jgi:hypothetical protein
MMVPEIWRRFVVLRVCGVGLVRFFLIFKCCVGSVVFPVCKWADVFRRFSIVSVVLLEVALFNCDIAVQAPHFSRACRTMRHMNAFRAMKHGDQS